MGKTLAYLRTSTDKQDLNNQKLEILDYTHKEKFNIDDFIEISISSRRSRRERHIDELLEKLDDADTLIVTELSRLGRSTGEVIILIDELIENGIRVIVIKQNMVLDKEQDNLQAKTMMTLLSLFAEMEREIISRRTKEALKAKKDQGMILGKPKGTQQASIYDKDRKRIVELLSYGVPELRIHQTHLNYGSASSLNYYIKTRSLKEEAERLSAQKYQSK